jgi:hypothetical protein
MRCWASSSGPGFPSDPLFFEDFRRTDKRARAALANSVNRNEIRGELRILAEMRHPIAVVHDGHDALALRTGLDPA